MDIVVLADRHLHRLAQLVRVQLVPVVLEPVDPEHVDSHDLGRAAGAERQPVLAAPKVGCDVQQEFLPELARDHLRRVHPYLPSIDFGSRRGCPALAAAMAMSHGIGVQASALDDV